MKKLPFALAALALPVLLGTDVRADFLNDAKNALNSDAGKALTNAAVEGTKKVAGKSVTGKLEAEINKRLLAEAAKNQCVFKTDSDVLEPGCDAKAKKLASQILEAKKQLQGAGIGGFKFEVSGHTDTRGDAAHNKELSEKRAAAIVKQLIAQGVAASDVISVGLGSSKPLVKPDNTPAKQAKNRRYELRVRL